MSDRFLISLFFLIFFSEAIHAQDNLSFKYFGLSIHPHGERDNAHLMPNKLDKNAYGVINYGAALGYEKFIDYCRLNAWYWLHSANLAMRWYILKIY